MGSRFVGEVVLDRIYKIFRMNKNLVYPENLV